MQLSQQTVSRWLEALYADGSQDYIHDYADDYGEPGYHFHGDGTTRLIVFGNYWLKEGHPKYRARDAGRDGGLSSWDSRYPRIMAQLESQSVDFQWYDEWTVIHDDGALAYRTQGDCYGWQPSWLYADGDLWAPDADDADDVQAVCAEHMNNPSSAINLAQFSTYTLERHGWTACNGRFESGWHPGQTDDPKTILPEWQAQYPECDFVFIISGVGQFDINFHLYRKVRMRRATPAEETAYLAGHITIDGADESDEGLYVPDIDREIP